MPAKGGDDVKGGEGSVKADLLLKVLKLAAGEEVKGKPPKVSHVCVRAHDMGHLFGRKGFTSSPAFGVNGLGDEPPFTLPSRLLAPRPASARCGAGCGGEGMSGATRRACDGLGRSAATPLPPPKPSCAVRPPQATGGRSSTGVKRLTSGCSRPAAKPAEFRITE